MDPTLVSVDAKDRAKDTRFRVREFRRMVAIAWPFRRLLLGGLIATVLFAALHTVSLAGTFPILKLLLEREGLTGWVDRTIAGERIGVDFAPPSEQGDLHVMRVSERGDSSLLVSETITDPDGGSTPDLLHKIACAESGSTIAVVVNSGSQQRMLDLTLGDVGLQGRVLRWGASFVPADANTEKGRIRLLSTILVGVALIVLVANIFRVVGEVLIAKALLSGMLVLRADLYERTLHLPMSFFANQPTADIVTRFVQDVQEIQRGLLTLFGKFIREPLRAVLILGLALTLDWRMTLMMVVVAPATVVLFWTVGRSVKKANRKLLVGYGRMIDALTTSLQNLRAVKAYTAESQERARLLQVDRKMFKQQFKLAKLQAIVSPTMETLGIFAGSMATLWLASRVISHELEISKFVSMGVVLAMLFDPLRKLTDVYVRVQRATAGAERIFQVLDHPVESDESASNRELAPLRDAIEYRDVWFTYPNAETPALCGVDLTIKSGETVAIVGPNGCGKTTLVSTLLRLFTPQRGTIRYDGLDIREAALPSLRRQIGLVSQEAIVFGGTPTENIAYGSESVDPERVRDAARRACADEFIDSLPGGFEADLGERGTTLSGGQRQRLAIARAIYRDAPILIFDEATSQIDTESEQKIQNSLREFSKDRTTLIIAHRLSTIQFADRIIVMDAGKVIDTGDHAALFKRCDVYRHLCETQFMTDTLIGARST